MPKRQSFGDTLLNIAGNLALDYGKDRLKQHLGLDFDEPQPEPSVEPPAMPEIGDIREIQGLQNRDGHVITIVGRPEVGKTVLAARIAEIIGRPTYIVSPVARPPSWMTRISINETKDYPPPYSTLILDDCLEYMSINNYNDPIIQSLEKDVFTARHDRKLMIIFCAQVSKLLDKYALGGGILCLKPPSILFRDLDSPQIISMHKKALEYWNGKSEKWLHRHAYIITHMWEGMVRVDMPTGQNAVIDGTSREVDDPDEISGDGLDDLDMDDVSDVSDVSDVDEIVIEPSE